LSKSPSSIFLYKTPLQKKNDVQQSEFVENLAFYLLIVNAGSDEQMLNFFCTNLNLIFFQLNAFELNLVKLKFNLMKFEFHSMFFQLNLD